jgi:putative transposase
VRRTVPPSAEIQAEIDKLLSKGMVDDPQKMLGDLARLGARLIIQRAVEEEFDTWLGRARYERRPERERGLKNDEAALRNGFRPRHLQTGEGELEIQIPQARHTTVPFVSKLFFEVALQAAVPHRPAQDVGDRRVRQGPVDA